MKLLWHSTSPWGPSSYSVLTRRAVTEIARLGYSDIMISQWYGLQGCPQIWQIRPRDEPKGPPVAQIRILPHVGGDGDYGAGQILPVYQMFQADVCITCMDIWVLPPELLSQMKVAAWVPVGREPAPQGIVDSARACMYPISFSRWGAEVLSRAGIEAHYVPCSADSIVFYPMPQAAAREKLTLPEACKFLVSMVAANKDPSDRKGFGEGLAGFARFAARHEDAYLYMHTLWGGPVNIGHIAERLGIANRVIQPNQVAYAMGMIDDDYMRWVYSASDVLLNPAKSEGFGLPLVEAQMCGCPIAATDYSTTDELMSAGWRIKGQLNWSIGADSWRCLAYVDSVVDALGEAYSQRGNELLRRQARQGALAYDSQRVAKEHWLPALKEIENLVCGSKNKLQLVTF